MTPSSRPSACSTLLLVFVVILSLHCPRSNAAVDTRATYTTTYTTNTNTNTATSATNTATATASASSTASSTASASATASATASDDADYFELPVSDVGPTSTASPGIHTLRIPRRHHRDRHRRHHKDARPVAGVVRDFGR